MVLPHSKLVTLAARTHLRPLGVLQKGRSRTWLDDRGWFVGVVEFQPSAMSAGSYLNVGAHFLWRWSGHLSFDLGHRVEVFLSYESEAQFAPEADRLAARAAAEVMKLRACLPAPGAVAGALPESAGTAGWPQYHRAVSFGLNGHEKAAAEAFHRVADDDGPGPAWLVELRRRCRALATLVTDPLQFRAEISGLVAAQRAALKLPELGAVFPE